ncbi:MAG: tetratricopeptide repeat protein [bacterium]|nr:tetratricopeptide repeat protein [bacterium]
MAASRRREAGSARRAAAPPAARFGAIPGRDLVLALALALTTLAVFAPALRLGWVNYDDPEYVLDNPHVRGGLDAANVRWALGAVHHATWHPLTTLSHQLDATLFGLDPAGHHAGNVLLHVGSTLLLFAFLRAATGAVWPALLAAALFGLHPLRVESVAWVSERKDALSTFLWLATCCAWLGWVRRGGAGRYALTVACFALGLLAKPMLVTLPAALLLLDWWPLARLRGRADLWPRVREKLPLVALAAAMAAITWRVQIGAGAVAEATAWPLGVRLANAAVAYVAYVRQTVWPAGLAVFYPPRPLGAGETALALAALLAATLGVLRLARRAPWLAVGWLWFLGTLVPVIGIVKAGEQAMADRFTYVPGIGLGLALAWSVDALVRARPAWTRVVAATAGVALVALAVATRMQLAHWRSSEALFRHALAVTTDNHLAHTNLAVALEVAGRAEEARSHWEAAVALRPRAPSAHASLGQALARAGDVAGAERAYRTALALDPRSSLALVNYGVLLVAQGRLDDAAAHFGEATTVAPDYAKAWAGLAAARAAQGRAADAVGAARRALALDPGMAEAHHARDGARSAGRRRRRAGGVPAGGGPAARRAARGAEPRGRAPRARRRRGSRPRRGRGGRALAGAAGGTAAPGRGRTTGRDALTARARGWFKRR